MKKVSIIGHFAEGFECVDGQTIKTKIITAELQRQLGNDQVLKFDTHGGLKTLLKAPAHVFCALKNSKNVLIFPAHNGVRVYGRLLPLFQKLFKGRKTHYVVIGGWLPTFLTGRRGLAVALKNLDGLYVETNAMKVALENQGFTNVYVMPNCKELTPLEESDLTYQKEMPFKLCTFSRVMKEKGIEDAAEAVRKVNEKLGYIAYSLDIFGQVDKNQTVWFENLQKIFPEYVSYNGVVPFDKSVDVLKNYYALLFPTYYEGEGFAGTLIDAFAAGVPVIASDWKYNAEIVDDGMTGAVYALNDGTGLENILLRAMNNVTGWNAMKANCLKKSRSFIPAEALKVMIKQFS